MSPVWVSDSSVPFDFFVGEEAADPMSDESTGEAGLVA